ncbi:MAG: hypothetical protein Q9172_003867 [Xanthocarpia lactea]
MAGQFKPSFLREEGIETAKKVNHLDGATGFLMRYLQNPETSRLLSDDPFRNYGSRFHANSRQLDEPDPEHIRQEREVLESIAHSMSE